MSVPLRCGRHCRRCCNVGSSVDIVWWWENTDSGNRKDIVLASFPVDNAVLAPLRHRCNVAWRSRCRRRLSITACNATTGVLWQSERHFRRPMASFGTSATLFIVGLKWSLWMVKMGQICLKGQCWIAHLFLLTKWVSLHGPTFNHFFCKLGHYIMQWAIWPKGT